MEELRQPAPLNQRGSSRRNALVVERRRRGPRQEPAVVDERDGVRPHDLAGPGGEQGPALLDRLGRQRSDQHAQERSRGIGIEDHRHHAGGRLPRAEQPCGPVDSLRGATQPLEVLDAAALANGESRLRLVAAGGQRRDGAPAVGARVLLLDAGRGDDGHPGDRVAVAGPLQAPDP